MIYLDTHVVVWLYAGLTNKLTEQAKDLINKNEVYISPIVKLELRYLYEIQRISVENNLIISDLSTRIGLKICDKNFLSIVDYAAGLSWTRDTFDRIITANAGLRQNILVTKDQIIIDNYPQAKW